jgi:hypothetical protein
VRFALLVLMFATGCIIPFATPPMRAELGGGTRIGGTPAQTDEMPAADSASSLHAAVGTHVASGTMTRKQTFDVGAGWTFDKSRAQTSNGIYLEGAYFLDRMGTWRTSVGPRTELRWLDDGGKAGAVKLRIDTEAYSAGERPFKGHDKCGTAAGTTLGTSSFGFFVEGGRVWAPEQSGGSAWIATAGITVRIPTALGVWVGIPWCK